MKAEQIRPHSIRIEVTDQNRETVMAMTETVVDWLKVNNILHTEVEQVPTKPIIYFHFIRGEDATAFRLRYKL